MNIPPPPPPPSDSDDFIPPPPAPADSDSDSDLELMAASRTGALSSKLSSDSEDEHLPPPPNGASHLRSPGVLHNRRKSAMNIFDSEIQQSFADLEHRIHASKPSLPSMPSTPLSGLIGLGSVDHDLPPPPAASFQQKPLSPSSTTTQEASRMTSASVSVSSFNSPPSPMSTITTSTSLYSPPLTRATSASTAVQPTNANGAINPMLQRRGSDFRSRVGSLPTSLAGALSPGSQNGTLTKAKCLMPGCTAFGVRNQYCLRHVWRLSVEELEPLNQKQYQVAKEIVTTEKSYADGLRIVYKSFLLRINTMIEMEPNKPLLDAKDIQCIFHNIEDLYKLAENLYSDLEEITLEKVLTSQIGTTLLHYAPQFRIYQTYLENYDDAIKQLHTIRKEKPEFDFFCKLQEKCEGLSLESFLIMPVQRLPRYLLLLAELIKRSESASFSDSALADMNSAKERISNIANSINASLHQKENQLKVLAIQNQFERDSRYQDLVTPTRYLIKEGALKKRYGKGSRHLSSSTVYYFFLFSDILVYADFSKNVLGKGVTYKLKHILPLNDMAVEPTSSAKGKNKDISVSTKSGAGDSKNFDLSCADTADRDVWLKAIQDAINRIAEDSKELKTTSFDGTSSKEKAGKSSKLKAMMGV